MPKAAVLLHELAWMLSVVTPMGLLERAHAYKDKIAKGEEVDHGLLFTRKRIEIRRFYNSGTISITVTSGLAQNRTRGAWPPSIPIPRLTYSHVPSSWYKPPSYFFPYFDSVIRAP